VGDSQQVMKLPRMERLGAMLTLIGKKQKHLPQEKRSPQMPYATLLCPGVLDEPWPHRPEPNLADWLLRTAVDETIHAIPTPTADYWRA
jgi:hypothetical protein